MENTKLNAYKNMIEGMFSSVEKAIGSHVLQLLIEHAHFQTKQKYEEADLIRYSLDGIFLDDLEKISEDKAELIAHEFIMQIISSLGRLVGKEMANKLTEYLHK